MDIFDKCFQYTDAREAIKAGYYPYFIPLSSNDGPVSEGRQLLRSSFMASHMAEQLSQVLKTLKKVGSQVGLINNKLCLRSHKPTPDGS